MDRCTEEVLQRYRRYAGRIMGHLFTEIIGPIWNEHPDLAPEWFRDKQSAPERAAARIPKDVHDELIEFMEEARELVSGTAKLAAEACSPDAGRRYHDAVGEALRHVEVTKRYLDSIPADEDPLPRDGG
jgi:hypothetical protein